MPLAICMALTIPSTAAAAKTLHIEYTDAPPTIDGILEVGEWQAAARISDMQEVRPIEFDPPSEVTEWFLSFDDRHLFIAAKASDSEPHRIVARNLRQGASIGSDDSMYVLLDAFNNKRSGYLFAVNPNGVRFDAVYTNGTRQSDEWDGIWKAASRLERSGWSMEMAIPFNTLTFDPQNDTWGLNVWREIPRRNETIAWTSRNGRVNPTVSGEVTGFKNLNQGMGLDVTPSLSTTYLEDHVQGRTDPGFNPSLDINYKIGSAVNALFTLNTDFAATEVDDRQLGLQRFSLFFPEKRNFFLTDFDIFQFGGVPTGRGRSARQVGLLSGTNGLAFFSRRIGLSDSREPVDLLYGTKVSGRLGKYDFGTLYIRQDQHENVSPTDVFLGRITRSLLRESSIGMIFTDGDAQSNEDGTLVGVDFLYRNTRLPNNRSIDIQAWLQKSERADVDDHDRAYSILFSLPSRTGFEGGAQYQRIEENFDPALGFVNRVGVHLYGIQGGYRNLLENGKRIQEVRHELSYSRWEYLNGGRVQSEDLELELIDIRSGANDALSFDVGRYKEGLLPGEAPLEDIGITIPAEEHTFYRYSASMRTSGHRPFAFDLGFSDGEYFHGERLQISSELEWAPSKHLQFAFEYEYNKYDFSDNGASTREVSLRNDIAFNARASLSTLVQYDDVSNDIGMNIRFRYNAAAGRDFWFVLNHNLRKDEFKNRFRNERSSAAAKVQYTLRF